MDAVIELFDRCYERRPNGFDAPAWLMVALPDAGGMADQDAWTMKALAWVRDVKNRLEQDLIKDAIKEADKKRGAAQSANETADEETANA